MKPAKQWVEEEFNRGVLHLEEFDAIVKMIEAVQADVRKDRRVVQIASQMDSVGKYLVIAVCNDGTIWQMSGLYEGQVRWTPMPFPG
jgi:hypothetical protein